MKKIYMKYIAIFALVCFSVVANAQTVLISPTGDGGFESGSSFAANGWTSVNHTTNTWQVGTASVPFAGTNAGFVSNDGGTTWAYTISSSQTSHFYRDITIPAGETKINFSFQWKGNGESGWDRLLIYAAPTTVLPVAGTPASSSTTLTGATLVYTQPSFAQATYINASILLPAALAGTTVRLIFTWQNDGSGGTSPGVSMDNISLTSSIPSSITSTTLGGLWSSPATWVGGVVPAGDDAIIADGAIVTVDQVVAVRDLTVGQGTSGTLQWNATANALTASRNVLVNSGANLNMFVAAASHAGVPINVGGNFTNNGTVHAAMFAAIINFNSTSSVSPSNLDGTGTFIGGIIGQLLNQSTGGVTINTSQNITTRALVHTAGALNTNGKLSLDNTATLFGLPFHQKIYNIVVTTMGTGYNTATPPTITIANPNMGVAATATPNIDDATGTLRSITITNAGDGYTSNPLVTITGGTGSGAAAIAVNNRFSSGGTLSSIQKSGIATISGGINIKSDQAVGAVASSSVLGVGYTSAPAMGFALPFGYQNLVTSGGSGYTTAPTVTVSGGTSLTGSTNPTFTVVVAQGKVVSVIAAAGGTLWTSPPTLTITGGGGSGATAEYPLNTLATATASISNGAINGYTLTNPGFGYTAAPTVGLVGGGFTTAATAFTAVGLYNLTLNYFAPAASNAPHTETGVMPANRRINILSMTNAVAGSAFTGDVEIYAAAPLTLSNSIVSFGSNTLFASHTAYAGVTGSLTNNISGIIKLSTPGGSLTRTFPFDAAVAVATGTGSLSTGSTVTSLTASRTAAPSGSVSPSGVTTGTRAYRIVSDVGAIFGINPTVTLNFNANDALVSDNPSLYIAQSTAVSGPWTVRSLSSGSGALPLTGSKTTATAAPGPIVPTGDDYFAWTTTFVPPITSATSGDWNSGTTWNGGVVPTCADNVQINNTHNVTITTAGNVAKQLTIAVGGTLTVSSGDLTIGCTLNNSTLNNNGTLTINGGTVWVNGNVAFNSPSNFNMSNGNLNIDPNDGTSVGSVASGTAILAIGSSSAAMTTNVTGGNILINDPPFTGTGYAVAMNTNSHASWSGSTIQFGGSSNTNVSTATNGFRVDCYINSGRLAFGNVIINGNDVTKPVTDVNYGINAYGDLTVNSGSELKIATTLSSFAGNINNNGIITATSAITLQLITGLSSTPTAVPNPQNIGGSGIFRNLAASPTADLNGLSVNNSSTNGVTLQVPLKISGTLTLVAGTLNTSDVNLLTVGISTAATGTMSRTAGWINGPVKKWFGTATGTTTFHLGTSTLYKPAPINFTTGAATGGTLTAKFSSVPPTFPNASPLMEGALVVNSASTQGSWFIEFGDGLTGGTYTATFTGNGATDILDYTKTVLIKRPSVGGGDWTLDGVHVTSTGSNTAPVVSRTGMAGFAAEYAIGGELGVVVPITMEFFRGAKQTTGNLLDWKVSCTSTPYATLTLERSPDGRSFSDINSQQATSLRCQSPFSYVDASPLPGVNYYRLKMTDADGKTTYSHLVVIINKEKGFEIVGLNPNPVYDAANLNLTTATAARIELMVTDINGRLMQKQSVQLQSGSNLIPLKVAALVPGSYQVTVITEAGEKSSLRFVKQ